MSSLKSSFARIHSAAASHEKTFAAAMVASAAEAARDGDCTAYKWIDSPCALRWLVAIVPMEDDCERVRQALPATIPEPDGPQSTHVIRAGHSYTAGHCVQLELPGIQR